MNDLGTQQVLLTGAAGWLGLNLLDALTNGLPDLPALRTPPAGLRVRCLLLPGQDASQVRAIRPDAEIVTGDVRSAEDCRRFVPARMKFLVHRADRECFQLPRYLKEFSEVTRVARLADPLVPVAARVRDPDGPPELAKSDTGGWLVLGKPER
jgi:hypothetical protein